MHIDIDNKLHKQIKEYCGANDLKINDFVNELLKKAFNIERYGLSPFEQTPQTVISSKEEKKETKVVEERKNKKRKPSYIPPVIKQQDFSCKKIENNEENIKPKVEEKTEKVHEEEKDFIDNPENKQVIKRSKKRKLN